MTLAALVVSLLSGAGPCEGPRVRDTAPLMNATAQDRVMAQTFSKAANACVERGVTCDQARLECSTLLTSTIQKQVDFDEGLWLRDMLLPFGGSSYPMTRVFGAAAAASDASCNVDVDTLKAAAQRRLTQATRRDALIQEYQGFTKWIDVQLKKCTERMSADDAKSAAAKAESERLAAVAAATAAAEALRAKQAQDAATAQAAAEKKERERLEAEATKQREAKEAAERADRQAREDKERDRQLAEEKQNEREKRAAEAKADAERKQHDADALKAVGARDSKLAEQRALKARLIKDAEASVQRAKDEEALKKQAAVDAVSSSPAIAQAAVVEAANAERARVDAEKRLFEAHQKADAIVIDDSFERSAGSAFIAGGGSAVDGAFGLGLLVGAHVGFWGTAPIDGIAPGLELRVWARYLGTVTGTPTRAIDSLLTARYFFGAIGVGLAGEFRVLDPNLATIRAGAGASLSAAIIDTHTTRVLLSANYLPIGTSLDPLRIVADFELSWRFIVFKIIGGTSTVAAATGGTTVGWQAGGYLGLRAAW